MKKIHVPILCAFMLSTAIINPAHACDPDMDWMNMPLAMKLKASTFFIGKITDKTDHTLTFTIITPSDLTKGKKAGDTITLPYGNHGTCGSLAFNTGETWLYHDDLSFSASRKLEPSDLADGTDLETVKQHVIKRLDPTYTPPRAPTKEDLPVPGTYVDSQECSADDQKAGRTHATYKLNISEPDKDKMYTVAIEKHDCKPEQDCTVTSKAPAYGYGEIILNLDPSKQPTSNCSLIIQQMSRPDEWPALTPGQAKVMLNAADCKELIPNCKTPVLDSGTLNRFQIVP